MLKMVKANNKLNAHHKEISRSLHKGKWVDWHAMWTSISLGTYILQLELLILYETYSDFLVGCKKNKYIRSTREKDEDVLGRFWRVKRLGEKGRRPWRWGGEEDLVSHWEIKEPEILRAGLDKSQMVSVGIQAYLDIWYPSTLNSPLEQESHPGQEESDLQGCIPYKFRNLNCMNFSYVVMKHSVSFDLFTL